MIKIDNLLVTDVSKKANESDRKRKNYNFHKNYSDVLQRMLNAINPESYVRPHKHENPDKREIFIILKGRMVLVEFDEKGIITDHVILDARKGIYGVEISPGIFHTIFSLENESVAYEIKDGPYSAIDDKNFATWAPEEDTSHASVYLKNLKNKLNL